MRKNSTCCEDSDSSESNSDCNNNNDDNGLQDSQGNVGTFGFQVGGNLGAQGDIGVDQRGVQEQLTFMAMLVKCVLKD